MSEENTATAAPENSKREKRIKAILILLILAAMVGIYFYQRRGLKIEGWGKDIDAALVQAKTENRPIVVLFVNKSQTPTARDLQKRISRPGNKKALQQGWIKSIRQSLLIFHVTSRRTEGAYDLQPEPSQAVAAMQFVERLRRVLAEP